MIDLQNKINERIKTLTPSQRVVADYISDNISSVAFTTLDELALDIGVSTTTVIRFTRALGYDGYSDMQQAIRNSIKNKESLPERFSAAKDHIRLNKLLVETFQLDIENLKQTLAGLNEEILNEAVNAIIDAKHIYVLGMRAAFSLAQLTASRLGQIMERVHLVQAVGMIYPEEVCGAEKGDLCIAFMFPRYAKMTVNLISWLKKRGVTVLIITSQNPAAIQTYGDIILPCATKGVSYKSSYTAPVSLINYLVVAVSIKYAGAMDVLSRTEEMLNQGYYLGI